VGHGIRRPANWLELVRFGLVGASGYGLNLAVFAFVVHAVGANHRVAALCAFLVAVANNFLWNRRWTFRSHTARAQHQAVRFLVVSVGAFLLNLAVLELLVAGAGLAAVPAQAIAIGAAMPVSFLGNKLWTFGR
jgi:dolichol-phosphate mannosyltransferase